MDRAFIVECVSSVRFFLFTFIIIYESIALSSCKVDEKHDNTEIVTETVQKKGPINTEVLRESIEEYFRNRRDSNSIQSEGLEIIDTLEMFYRERGYASVWCDTESEDPQLSRIIAVLQEAYENGIPCTLYNVSLLERLYHKYISCSEINYHELASLDVILSDAILRYARDLHYGVLSQHWKRTQGKSFPFPDGRDEDIFRPLQWNNAIHFLKTLQPEAIRYTRLQIALHFYRSLLRKGGWGVIPPVQDKIEIGDTNAVIPLVAQRILMSHSLRWKASVINSFIQFLPMNCDSLILADQMKWNAIKQNIYDSTLFRCVVSFQTENGLQADGVIGNYTINRLNLSPRERIAQIVINLERFRWFQYPAHSKYVMVNIPEFYLYAMENAEIKFKMKVCTGERFHGWSVRGHAPRSYETPMLKSEISYLVLNPTWSVPQSIASREIYYEALKDSNYLWRRNYKVYYRDSLVNNRSINWNRFDARKLPFRFIQHPGERNALGKIKFMFYNEYSIYLHDTPKRLPFQRANRAVSHGCVRVEEPMKLLDFVLKGHPMWNNKRVFEYLGSTRKSKVVMLQNNVPLYIDYYTVWVDENGEIAFREDVYGKDRALRLAWLQATYSE